MMGGGRLEAAIWEMAATRMKDDRLKERNQKGGSVASFHDGDIGREQ